MEKKERQQMNEKIVKLKRKIGGEIHDLDVEISYNDSKIKELNEKIESLQNEILKLKDKRLNYETKNLSAHQNLRHLEKELLSLGETQEILVNISIKEEFGDSLG